MNNLKNHALEIKRRLGKKLCILAHYYQRDEVYELADKTGDSLTLARAGAKDIDAEYIVFCGVRFMAESTHILARPNQKVYLTNTLAGCPLADTAEISDVEEAWNFFGNIGAQKGMIPVTYINSSADVKAFCGKNGGIVCTSSSAASAFEWAFSRGEKIFFMSDENLGWNTASKLKINDNKIFLWDKNKSDINEESLKNAKLVLWNGHCHVHALFTPNHVKILRKKYPGIFVAVHPECSPAVTALSDAVGSTSFLIKCVEESKAGSVVAIGTEISLVSRLAKTHKNKKIIPLARSLCPNMFKTSLGDLCRILENFSRENEIMLPEDVKANAKTALNRMLEL